MTRQNLEFETARKTPRTAPLTAALGQVRGNPLSRKENRLPAALSANWGS